MQVEGRGWPSIHCMLRLDVAGHWRRVSFNLGRVAVMHPWTATGLVCSSRLPKLTRAVQLCRDLCRFLDEFGVFFDGQCYTAHGNRSRPVCHSWFLQRRRNEHRPRKHAGCPYSSPSNQTLPTSDSGTASRLVETFALNDLHFQAAVRCPSASGLSPRSPPGCFRGVSHSLPRLA
jgi:hypothetical protein